MEAITKFGPVEGGLSVVADPNQMLRQARDVADVLMRLVEEKKLYLTIGKKKHLYVEAWETLGHFYGVTGKITDVRPVVDEITGAAGFEATADAIHMQTTTVISSARALCLNNEENWDTRPKYEYEEGKPRKLVGEVPVPTFQLESMAQTRAVGKVLRNVLAFVVALAGYATTPAEEMTGTEREKQANGKDPQPKKEAAGAPKRITDPQRKRMFAIMHEHQVPTMELVNIIKKHGFNQAFEITVDKYDAIISEIQNWSPQEPA
jgi:hypothetical protein